MIIHGTITKTLDDGSTTTADYSLDTESGEVVQVGGEGTIDVDDTEIVSMLLEMFHGSPEDFENVPVDEDGNYDPANDPTLDEATRARYVTIADQLKAFDPDTAQE